MTDDDWTAYGRLQPFADTDVINDKAWATDDLLMGALMATLPGNLSSLSPERLEGVLANRRAKHRHRRRLFASHVAAEGQPRSVNSLAAIEARLELAKLAEGLDEGDLRILIDLAMGYTHDEIATAMGLPIGTVKTRAHRARLKLKA